MLRRKRPEDPVARTLVFAAIAVAAVLALFVGADADWLLAGQTPPAVAEDPYPLPPRLATLDLLRQSAAEAHAKSAGCVICHQNCQDPHFKETLNLGCSDCHGGNPATNVK